MSETFLPISAMPIKNYQNHRHEESLNHGIFFFDIYLSAKEQENAVECFVGSI